MSTRPTPTARQPSYSKPAPPPTTKEPSTLLHASAVLTGSHSLTLGPKSIIQVRARINTAYTPLTIGASTTIAERASIGYLSHPPPFPPPNASSPEPAECTIGNSVIIESGATVEAGSVGDYSIVEAGAVVGKGAIIGSYCKICAKVEVPEGGVVEDGMVVWGDGWGQRRMEREGMGLRSPGMREGMVEGVVGGVKAVGKGK